MKKRRMLLHFLLALLPLLGGIVHPFLHLHDTDYAVDPSGEIHASAHAVQIHTDDSSCQICSGFLNLPPLRSADENIISHLENTFFLFEKNPPLFHGDSTRRSRAPPFA